MVFHVRIPNHTPKYPNTWNTLTVFGKSCFFSVGKDIYTYPPRINIMNSMTADSNLTLTTVLKFAGPKSLLIISSVRMVPFLII